MDDRLWICLWMIGGGGLGAVLGGAFGALAAVLYAQSGGAAGTRIARRIVENFLDTAERQPSSAGRAALIGAADGVLFLGLLGLLAGALMRVSGRAADELLLPFVVGSVLLVGGAAFFGGLAYSLSRNGLWAVLCIFAGGLCGTFLVGLRLGADNCLLGTIPGLLVGLILSLIQGRYAPTFHSPHVGKPSLRPRSDNEIDITGPPHLRPGSDAFRKPDADEP
jgi:hypothetical protein